MASPVSRIMSYTRLDEVFRLFDIEFTFQDLAASAKRLSTPTSTASLLFKTRDIAPRAESMSHYERTSPGTLQRRTVSRLGMATIPHRPVPIANESFSWISLISCGCVPAFDATGQRQSHHGPNR